MTDDDKTLCKAMEQAAARIRELYDELATVRRLARDMAVALDVAIETLNDEGVNARAAKTILTAWQEHEGKQP